MRNTRHAGEILESLPAPVLARLIERGLIAEWPIEITAKGRYVARAVDADAPLGWRYSWFPEDETPEEALAE